MHVSETPGLRHVTVSERRRPRETAPVRPGQQHTFGHRVRARVRHGFEKLVGVRLGILRRHTPIPLRLPDRYTNAPDSDSLLVFSVVTPSYNQGQFLEQTIQSVLAQRYPRLEYIIQDGGSTDDTHAILCRYKDRLTYCESKRDNGQPHAINQGFRHATGDVLAWLNSDDLLLPGTLHYVARFFDRNPEVDVAYGHRVLIDARGEEINRWVMPCHDDAVLSWVDYIPQETLFWRRRIWEKIGAAVDESFQFALDWDLLLRFRDAGARFRRLPRFLGAFRVHPDQKTIVQAATVGANEIKRLMDRCHGRSVSPLMRYRHIFGYLVRHAVCHKLYSIGLFQY